MSEQNNKEVEVLTIEQKKSKLHNLKADVFDIMDEWEGLQGKLQALQQKKMKVITEINKLKVEIKPETDPVVVEPVK